LGFLDYELPIFNERNLEHLQLEVSGQLVLDLLEDTPDQFSILYKVMDVLIQQW
jgi:hypothetical protein